MKRSILVFIISWLHLALYAQQTITPSTALDTYIHNGDPTFAWEVRDSYTVGETKAYSLFFVSQKWQGMLWKHELIVFVPEKINHDLALLTIGGGDQKEGVPLFSHPGDNTSLALATIATKQQAITAHIRQIPNQPLYNGLLEDALISYTLGQYLKEEDYSWPLLFPMVKSVHKAMDVIQEFANEQNKTSINRFMLTGSSKRGWTTWLTAALQEKRIVAIAPKVIDMLNIPVSMAYQKEVYGQHSEEVSDYEQLDITELSQTEIGKAIIQMIDPYSYRNMFTMPKVLFMGTNDAFWVLDAVKNYIDEIPGQNHLCYIPNVGHGLGDETQYYETLTAFFGLTRHNKSLPACEWLLTEKGGKITLKVTNTTDQPIRAMLWSAESDSRDFRKAHWKEKEIISKNKSQISQTLRYPRKGFFAFYMQLIYTDPDGNEYSITTRPYVADSKQVFIK